MTACSRLHFNTRLSSQTVVSEEHALQFTQKGTLRERPRIFITVTCQGELARYELTNNSIRLRDGRKRALARLGAYFVAFWIKLGSSPSRFQASACKPHGEANYEGKDQQSSILVFQRSRFDANQVGAFLLACRSCKLNLSR